MSILIWLCCAGICTRSTSRGIRIVLELEEFRESIDVDFLCSDREGYRELDATLERIDDSAHRKKCIRELAVSNTRKLGCGLFQHYRAQRHRPRSTYPSGAYRAYATGVAHLGNVLDIPSGTRRNLRLRLAKGTLARLGSTSAINSELSAIDQRFPKGWTTLSCDRRDTLRRSGAVGIAARR